MKIVLIRHGLTAGNREKRYIGRTDEPLCAEGIERLKEAVAAGTYPAADVVVVSPMLRCRQTAEIIYGKRDVMEIPELVEMDFGQFEGMNYAELNGDPRYQEWIDSNGTLPFPDGESQAQFVERTMAGYRKLEAAVSAPMDCDASQNSGTVAVICHGGTIMAILSSLGYGSYFDFQTKNGGGYCFETGGSQCSII